MQLGVDALRRDNPLVGAATDHGALGRATVDTRAVRELEGPRSRQAGDGVYGRALGSDDQAL